MARIRSLHPGFWTDEVTMQLSVDCPLGIAILQGLWNEADDQGVFEWKPLTIKARVLPAAPADVAAILETLARLGAIKAYEVAGKKFGAVRNFRKFQRPKTPSAIHPITDEIREYVGLIAAVSETPEPEREAFPPKGEMSAQMEDGGGRMEEKDGGEESLHLSGEAISPPDEAFAIYLEACDRQPVWTRHRELPRTLLKPLQSRLAEIGGVEAWRAVIRRCEASKWLTGRRGDRPFKLTLDYLTKPENLRKILDGNYDDAPSTDATASEFRRKTDVRRAGILDALNDLEGGGLAAEGALAAGPQRQGLPPI